MKLSARQIPALGAPDATLALLGLALLLVGLVAITSASIEYAEWRFQNAWYHSQRHSVYLLAGVIAAAATYRVNAEFWQPDPFAPANDETLYPGFSGNQLHRIFQTALTVGVFAHRCTLGAMRTKVKGRIKCWLLADPYTIRHFCQNSTAH